MDVDAPVERREDNNTHGPSVRLEVGSLGRWEDDCRVLMEDSPIGYRSSMLDPGLVLTMGSALCSLFIVHWFHGFRGFHWFDRFHGFEGNHWFERLH